jgi:hypothetical protein
MISFCRPNIHIGDVAAYPDRDCSVRGAYSELSLPQLLNNVKLYSCQKILIIYLVTLTVIL